MLVLACLRLFRVTPQEADLAASVINPTSEKRDVAFESETILPIELMILAGRLSKHQSNIFGIIQVLTWEHGGVGTSVVIQRLGHWGPVGDVSPHLSNFVQAFRSHFWSFVENSFLEASKYTPKRLSARVVVGSFWLLVIVVTTVVAGQMKAMMMVREEADRIDSMRHLASRPAMKPYTVAGSAGVSSVRDSKDPDYQTVWRMMQKHKTDLPTSVVLADQTLLEVVAGKAVLILSRASVATRATAACASFERGEFYLAREPMFKFNSVFYINKRLSPTRRQAINNRILWLRESGLVAKWWQESSGNWEGCGQVISDGRLTFSDFQDLLLFWLAMLGIATAVFLCESACAYAPYHVFKHGGLDAPIQGVCGEILKAVVSSMQMRYDLIQARDPLWGLRKENGNWTGLIGMVQRDVITTTF
ncbi:hypothetical protein HPB49_021755 [Dermacentor silvarum]|uniref:Uncharacterized protein n=1 Tax=Dermacentor silvarum TaxID=543639 RepID=A0ACB8CB96_DERSI|nr:hypothetical protein HPB49_021755 [Dermacentor silvarum]